MNKNPVSHQIHEMALGQGEDLIRQYKQQIPIMTFSLSSFDWLIKDVINDTLREETHVDI